MIIIWSVVIAIALVIEFLTYDMVTSWFAVGGLAALIIAAAGVENIWWQIGAFFIIPLICLLFLRRFVVRFVKVKTTPTNLDANIGQHYKLLQDVKDGRSQIKINDVLWTVSSNEDMKEGELAEVTGMAGNRYIVASLEVAKKMREEAESQEKSKSRTKKPKTSEN